MRWPPLLSGKKKKLWGWKDTRFRRYWCFFLYIPGDLVVLVTCASWIDYGREPDKTQTKTAPKPGQNRHLARANEAQITQTSSTERPLLWTHGCFFLYAVYLALGLTVCYTCMDMNWCRSCEICRHHQGIPFPGIAVLSTTKLRQTD